MSNILYSSDNISIIGDIITQQLPCNKQEDGRHTPNYHWILKLIFNIQINGKLKSVEYFFDLDTVKNDSLNRSLELTLRGWGNWLTILNTLYAFGYNINDYSPQTGGSNIISKWINDIHNNIKIKPQLTTAC